METALALLIRLMRRARLAFLLLYLVVAAGFLYADPRSGWSWFIVVAGAALCALFWVLVAFWSHVFGRRPPEDRNGRNHG